MLLDGATGETAIQAVLSTTTDHKERQHTSSVCGSALRPRYADRTVHHPAGDVRAEELVCYALVEWVLHSVNDVTNQTLALGL